MIVIAVVIVIDVLDVDHVAVVHDAA